MSPVSAIKPLPLRHAWAAFLLCLFLGLGGAGVAAETPYGGWHAEFLGTDPNVRFYPDTNANYWVYVLDRSNAGANVGLRIQGAFPKARYMSVVVYDSPSHPAQAALTDVDIAPSSGSVNPFVEGCEDHLPTNYYEVLVAPQGRDSVAGGNRIEYSGSAWSISVFLRYYLPEPNATGGVDLPKITAYDLDTGEPIEPPVPFTRLIELGRRGTGILNRVVDHYVESAVRPLIDVARPGNVFAYRPNSNGLFANPDNDYLGIPLDLGPDEVAVLRFKTPTHARTCAGTGSEDTRYWSLSLGDVDSLNLFTLADKDTRIGEDGFARVVIARPSRRIAQRTQQYNFIPWTLDAPGLLVYRNLMTRDGFAGDMRSAPVYNGPLLWWRYIASWYIGQHAPIGRIMSTQQFLDNY